MKKIITRYLMLGILITSVSNFSFVSAQHIYARYETYIYCEAGSQDPFCIEAAKADVEGAGQRAYCKASSICGSASEAMTLLMDFVREMTNSIKTIATEGDYLGQYVSPNQFKGTVFVPITGSIVSKLERNVTQKFKFGLAATAIFANPVNFAGTKDVVGGTVLLAKNKVFLRDNKIIETLESQVTDKKYELGLGGGWYEKIIPENIQIMNDIIKKYIDAGLLTETSRIKDGALYNNVTSLLTQMLSAAKSFLYFDSTDQFGEISRGGADGAVIIFNDLAMQTLQMDYSCARGLNNPCDSAINDFSNNMKNVWKSTKDSWSETKRVFTNALDRLDQTFSPDQQDDEFKAREAELLTSMYGTTKVTPGKLIDITVDETNGSISDLGSGIDAISSLRSWNLKTDTDVQATKEEVQKIASPLISKDTFALLMNDYVADVFVSQAFDASELATFSEVKDITPAFKVLGDQIRVIKNDILGSKQQENSLIWSLGKACELQCGGGGLCR